MSSWQEILAICIIAGGATAYMTEKISKIEILEHSFTEKTKKIEKILTKFQQLENKRENSLQILKKHNYQSLELNLPPNFTAFLISRELDALNLPTNKILVTGLAYLAQGYSLAIYGQPLVRCVFTIRRDNKLQIANLKYENTYIWLNELQEAYALHIVRSICSKYGAKLLREPVYKSVICNSLPFAEAKVEVKGYNPVISTAKMKEYFQYTWMNPQ